MNTINLISAYQGANALENLGIEVDRKFRKLKSHEIKSLKSFCNIMRNHKCTIKSFDGFFLGYSIEQIGKEFDLLRFSDNLILNIEIKSELKTEKKEEKILKQLQLNYYYLKFCGRQIKLFSYVENDGFYEYDIESNRLCQVDASDVAYHMQKQIIDYSINLDQVFLPSNYLVSPFNSTDKFMMGEYFLTKDQQTIKKDIFNSLTSNKLTYFTISANAGTGKTLMMYDIAKDLIKKENNPILIHCGLLNFGHQCLINQHKWNIHPIKDVSSFSIDSLFEGCSIVLIDEAQRISETQLNLIIQKSNKLQIPIIFSYDVKQYLKTGESRNIEEYLNTNYSCIQLKSYQLTNKIRTNKELASFITNLLNIGRSKDHLNYDSVSIEYFSDVEDLQNYINFLSTSGWTSITFTTSRYDSDPYASLANFCEKNAHSVIGQEFSKVVFVMNDNFKYEDNRLTAREGYYSAKGMLYQIITRVVDNLKIIVLNNPILYKKLLEIKDLGQ